ncbi:MAG: hypothetical protein HUK28_02030 [Methanobrevibacter sp.]|nr:hypothetical protein [Methanobrevibacter sp.]
MSLKRDEIKLFENKEIRTVWHSGIDGYYISVIDIIAAITESKNPNRYWSDLKIKLKEESGQPYENIVKLKMPAKDGKMRETDVATVKQMLRIIQSIPSPKAEPIKQWLAQLGQERLDEIADPEQAIERAIDYYREKGHSEEWISQRLRSIEIRKDLTSEWNRSGVEQGLEYTMLTNEVSKAWSGMTTREYKDYKSLRKESLRDNMTNTELVLNMLAEVSTTEISRAENPEGFEESKDVAQRGGNIAGDARKNLEKQLGKKVISKNNSNNPRLLDE